MKEKRQRRSHEEVVAAREAYLEAKKAKQEVRLEKARLRAERKAAREARKAMTPEERKASKIAAARGRIKLERESDGYEPFKGQVNVGDFVAAIFAGCPIRGTVVSVSKDMNSVDQEGDTEIQFRKGASSVTLYNVRGADDGLIYPVRREKIVAKKSSK